jgi:hypothetical protein
MNLLPLRVGIQGGGCGIYGKVFKNSGKAPDPGVVKTLRLCLVIVGLKWIEVY